MSESFVYIINSQYELIWFNEAMEKICPQIIKGRKCYELLCGESRPCVQCPICQARSQGTAMFWNRLWRKWVRTDTVEVSLPEYGRCFIITTEFLQQKNQNEIINLLNYSAYDELISVDLRKDRAQNVIHEDGKYQIPANEGSYTAMIAYAKQNTVYPDDRDLYQAFMDPDTLKERLAACGPGGYLEARFRKKKMDGTWILNRYVLMGCGNSGNTDRVLWLVYDLEKEKKNSNPEIRGDLKKNKLVSGFIEQAIENGEISFWLQPTYRMPDRKIVGAEALVRWNRYDGSKISPDAFIPVLEQAGQITTMDCYIWESVCNYLRGIMDSGFRPVPISINISDEDIFTMDLPAYLHMLIEKYHIDPSLIKLEITEEAYDRGPEHIQEVLTELHRLGFQVMMDNFGNDYSFLNTLKDLPFDAIKLDIRFLELDPTNENKSLRIMESIAKLADSMGVQIIAEGVENQPQAGYLQMLGCDYAQGYYYARPMKNDEFRKIIESGNDISYDGIRPRPVVLSAFACSQHENALLSEKLLITLRLAHLNSWDWNLKNRELRLINVSDMEDMSRISPMLSSELAVVPDYPDVIIRKGMVEGTGVSMLREYEQWIYHAEDRQEMTFRIPFLAQDHSTVWLQFTGMVMKDSVGKPERAIGFYTDITKQLDQARNVSFFDLISMEKEKESYLTMINGLTAEYSNVFHADLERDIFTFFRLDDTTDRLFGSKVEEITSYRELMTYYIDHSVYAEDQYLLDCLLDRDQLEEKLRDRGYFNINYRSCGSDDISYCQIKAARGGGKNGEVIIGIRNIDEEFRRITMLEKQARIDGLTGLLNKQAFKAAVRRELTDQDRGGIAFLFLDMDHFKQVNDTLGHSMGDTAIINVARGLQNVFRKSDLIGRFGGDEFCVFLKNIPREILNEKLEQCLTELRKDYPMEEGVIHVTVSIGAVYCRENAEVEEDQLNDMADAALYESKRAGRNRWTTYEFGA